MSLCWPGQGCLLYPGPGPDVIHGISGFHLHVDGLAGQGLQKICMLTCSWMRRCCKLSIRSNHLKANTLSLDNASCLLSFISFAKALGGSVLSQPLKLFQWSILPLTHSPRRCLTFSLFPPCSIPQARCLWPDPKTTNSNKSSLNVTQLTRVLWTVILNLKYSPWCSQPLLASSLSIQKLFFIQP